MTLTVRSATVSGATTKGSALTHAELDENFNHLSQSSNHTFTPSGTATAENVQSRLRWQVYITDYLSDADRASVRAGTTVNIDTALTNAHGALPTNGGDIIFPPGKYKLTAKPSLTKRVKLLGAGISEQTGTTGTTVVIKDAAMTTTLIELAVAGSEIEGIEFEGENGNTGDGVVIKAGRCALRSVASYSMGNDGIRIGDDSAEFNTNLFHLERIITKGNGRDGVHLSDKPGTVGANCNAGTLLHLDSASNTRDGLHVGTAFFNTIVNPTCQSNGRNGITYGAESKKNIQFGGDTDEGNTTNEISIEAGATGNMLIGVQPEGISDASATGANLLVGWTHSKFRSLYLSTSTASDIADTPQAGKLEIYVDAAGSIDVAMALTSNGNAAAGRGPAMDFYLPISSGNSAAARIAAVREGANATGALAFYTKTAAGSVAETLRMASSGALRTTGKIFYRQAAPETATDTATLTGAQMLSGILVATPTAAANYTTLTGALLEDAVVAIFPQLAAGDSFDLTIINIGGTGDDITLVAGATGMSIVGDAVVRPSADSGTEQAGQGTFRFRYTAADTFIAYRVS
jgi:hypothetical protein